VRVRPNLFIVGLLLIDLLARLLSVVMLQFQILHGWYGMEGERKTEESSTLYIFLSYHIIHLSRKADGI